MIRILEWNVGYETADTRKLQHKLPWVRMNVLLADQRWAELWLESNAPQIWAGWTALVFCASQSKERGTVESVKKVAILSRVPEKFVQSGLEWALANGMAESDQESEKDSGKIPESFLTTLRDGTERDETRRNNLAGDCLSIYEAYPKKAERPEALKEIATALKIIAAPELLAAVKEYATAVNAWPDDEKHFAPSCGRWMKRQRWLDDRSTWLKKQSGKPAPKLNGFTADYYEKGRMVKDDGSF